MGPFDFSPISSIRDFPRSVSLLSILEDAEWGPLTVNDFRYRFLEKPQDYSCPEIDRLFL